jgi:hypothetical protein
MSRGRAPNQTDLHKMRRALALTTAYDVGIEENDFTVYKQLLAEEEDPQGLIQALSQFSWLMLKSLETQGVPRNRVLAWYGQRFARKA